VSDVHKPAVMIDNNSKGNALKVKSLHSPSVNSAIDVQYDGQAFGININSTKGSLHALTTSNVATIVTENYSGGTALKALTDDDTCSILAENTHMFGVGIQSNVTGSQATAVKGIANSAGAAIEGINSAGSGIAVLGRTTTTSVGYGIRGETSSNSLGIPGQFISNNPNANTNTLWLIDWSLGETQRIQVNNNSNNSDALHIVHSGTGNLARFSNGAGDKITFSNSGNITTAGTMTVKNNKGIVRNSSATQMRMETFSANCVYFNMPQGGSVTVNISFATAFSSAPVVSIGDIESGFTGPCDKMVISVKNVTTTGCTVTMYNPSVSGNPTVSGTWNFVAIGAE
jgi:hypothetical protein